MASIDSIALAKGGPPRGTHKTEGHKTREDELVPHGQERHERVSLSFQTYLLGGQQRCARYHDILSS